MNGNDDLLAGLNPEQYKAVTTKGNMLVLAGAGSGKTKVLSTRIASLMQNDRVDQAAILAVTFTNKAAKEMRGRISKMCNNDPLKALWVGTFHGICNQILREYGRKLGIDPNFHILDEADQQSMVKRLVKEMGITNDLLKNTYGETISGLCSKIMSIKESGQEVRQDKSLLVEVFYKYHDACRREGAMDFADLMLKVNRAMSNNTAGILDHYRDRFKYILVDEFQDTNPEQFKWLSFMKAPEAEIFAVGDDDQSIYSFRGADPAAMMKFLDKVAGGNIIRLETNYRSTSNILAAANGVINNNSGRIGKELRTPASSGSRIQVLEFESDHLESGFIAKTIKDLLAAGEAHHEIAILYRSNHQSSSLERAMLNHQVPYIIHGGTRFFERQEVKDVLAYIRLAYKNNDDNAFMRVVNNPPRGIGAKTIDPILEVASQESRPALDVAVDDAYMNPNSKFKQFVDLITEIDVAMHKLTLPDFVEYVIERSGLLDMYKKGNESESESRLNNIGEIINLALRHMQDISSEPVNAYDALGEFLTTFTLEDAPEGSHQNKKKAVTLMTIHASKGLEFNHVFINGVEEGQLPHKNNMETDFGVEEERRLMYVAITRARKGLNICHSSTRRVYGQEEEREPSRFISEIPTAVCDYRFFEAAESRPAFGGQRPNPGMRP